MHLVSQFCVNLHARGSRPIQYKIVLSVYKGFVSHWPFFCVLQSDDSLGHLSAEEKACLLFLEETIESLDTEEDSGLSNDEPEQLPNPGNVATKLADLSASMKKINLNSQFISEHTIDAHLPIEQSMKYFEEIYVVSLMTLFPYRFKDTYH